MSDATVHVDILRKRLDSLEAERRFGGQAYPTDMAPFPFHLSGQGFFPGGDGLWRDDDLVREISAQKIARNGVLFLGNDFGTLKIMIA